MAKDVFENIIIDIVRTDNSKITPLNDKDCEQILQTNVKENGSILNKEKALLNYSEIKSGIPISFFTQNENRYCWLKRIVILIVALLSWGLMKATVDPKPDIIYIDNVFGWYCLLPLFLWFCFWCYNWYNFFRKRKKNNNNDDMHIGINSVFNPLSESFQWLCHFKWFNSFIEFMSVKIFNKSADNSTQSKLNNNLSLTETVNKLVGNKYIKCSLLFLWKLIIISSLIAGAVVPFFTFRNNKEHTYGYTIGDSWNVPAWWQELHAHYFVDPICKAFGFSSGYYKYLHNLNELIQNATDKDLVEGFRKLNEENQSTGNNVAKLPDSLKELEMLDNNQKVAYRVKYAMNTVSTDYRNSTKKPFNRFCFNYVIWCLATPILPHLFYLLFYSFACWQYKRDLEKKNSVKFDDNGNVIDSYQANVLRDLDNKFRIICTQKLVWLQISENSKESGVKLPDLKNWCDNNGEFYLANKEKIKFWIETQNRLAQHPYVRTLVCLCDISRPISASCIELLSELSNKDKYDIHIALVYDQTYCEEYPTNTNKIDEELNQWKSKLFSINNEFSKEFCVSVFKLGNSPKQTDHLFWLNESVKTQKLNLEEAFKRVFDDLELQCKKLVWLQITDHPENSFVKNSNLKDWCDKDKKNNIFLNGNNAVDSWIEKHNKLSVPCHTRTLVCLCDISHPVSASCINRIAGLANQNCYDICFALLYGKNFIENYPQNTIQIDKQLNQWKSSLTFLEKGFSSKYVWIPEKDSSDSEQEILFDEIKNSKDLPETNLEIEEAFKRIFEELDFQCHKFVWLQITDDPDNSFVKKSDLKNWCDKDVKKNVFLDDKDAIDSWIEKYNKLSVQRHARTLVCLCDISQSVSEDCISRISELINKDCYDIRFALVYDKNFIENYPNNSAQVDNQLNQWKTSLTLLEKDFSKSSVWIPEKDSPDSELCFLFNKIKGVEDSPEANWGLEEAFKRIFEKLDLQCRKLVWLQIADDQRKAIVNYSDLKDWCAKDKKNNIFLDGKEAIDSWIEKHNKLSVPRHARALICLCDIVQSVSNDCINRLFRLSNRDRYDIHFALIYDNNLKEKYCSNQGCVAKQLDKWTSNLKSLGNKFSRTSVSISEISPDSEQEDLFEEIKDAENSPESNLKIKEAFERIIKDITPKPKTTPKATTETTPKTTTETALKTTTETAPKATTETALKTTTETAPKTTTETTPKTTTETAPKTTTETAPKTTTETAPKTTTETAPKTTTETAPKATTETAPKTTTETAPKTTMETAPKAAPETAPKTTTEKTTTEKTTGSNLISTSIGGAIANAIVKGKSLIDQVNEKAQYFVDITPSSLPEPQPYCKTLLIIHGLKGKDQQCFKETFDKYAADKAKKAPMSWYTDINNHSKIINDIEAEQTSDQNNNSAVYYRITLIVDKNNSRFDGGEKRHLKQVISKINEFVQKQPQVQNQPLKVFIVVTTDPAFDQKMKNDSIGQLNYWTINVFKDLKNTSGTNVEYSLIKDFNYRGATQSSWTEFCAKIFPESNIQVVKLPTREERIKMFSDAIGYIQKACEIAFDKPQDKDACIEQTLQLGQKIHDIYFANVGNNYFQDILGNGKKAGQTIIDVSKQVAGDVTNGAQQFGGKIVDSAQQLGSGFWGFVKKYIPSKESVIGGSFGALAFTVCAMGASFATGGAIPGIAYIIGASASGLFGGATGGTIGDLWSKNRDNRQKELAEKDPDFEKEPKDVQDRIIQVESLISSGLTLALVFDGQGYSEETILETLKQVLQPLDVLYIHFKDDVKPCLKEVRNRWEKRCINNK